MSKEENDIDNISDDIKTYRDNSTLYNFLNSNIGERMIPESKFTVPKIGDDIITNLKKKSAGVDRMGDGTARRSIKWVSKILAHSLNTKKYNGVFLMSGYRVLPPAYLKRMAKMT